MRNAELEAIGCLALVVFVQLREVSDGGAIICFGIREPVRAHLLEQNAAVDEGSCQMLAILHLARILGVQLLQMFNGVVEVLLCLVNLVLVPVDESKVVMRS